MSLQHAVQYALKYIASCWDGDLVGNILGAPYQPRRPPGGGGALGGSSSAAIENVTLLSILLPDRAEAPKPALASPATVKHALAALTSLVQVWRQSRGVFECVCNANSLSAACVMRSRSQGRATSNLPSAPLVHFWTTSAALVNTFGRVLCGALQRQAGRHLAASLTCRPAPCSASARKWTTAST